MESKSAFKRYFMIWLSLLILMALFATTTTPAAAKSSITSKVPATAKWVNTKIILAAGQTVTIQAKGSVTTLKGSPKSKGGPNGQKNAYCPVNLNDPPCPLNNSRYGALVGKIGYSGTPFYVGKKLTFTPKTSGTLYLAVNDNLPWYFDNAGAFNITVKLP